jgi:prolyl 4-hydroxylase
MSATPHQDLRHFIRVYDDALPATWCSRMLAGFSALSAHHARNGRELRTSLADWLVTPRISGSAFQCPPRPPALIWS